MSKPAASPTARLLQSSRLFSLPRPLPVQPELTSGTYRSSDTATTPYPTHQAIATPSSSLHRGDWGLKRALPHHTRSVHGKKLGRASREKWVRVRANDTYEHITDFASSGDVVMAGRKWAAMEVPLVQGRKNKGEASVFEAWLDNTDRDAVEAGNAWQSRKEVQRWKYDGPYVADMQDGEFHTFLRRTVESPGKRAAWREFLRENETEERVRSALEQQRRHRVQAAQDGVQDEAEDGAIGPGDLDPEELRSRLRLTDEEVTSLEKTLRDEYAGLSSKLTRLVTEFLDLPSLYNPGRQIAPGSTRGLAENLYAGLRDEDDGPPTTHPSAGLGHLRSNAVMFNHPIYGPQVSKTPVRARVVLPRKGANARLDQFAKLGVGGFVANDPKTATKGESDSGSKDERMVDRLDASEAGGNKIWVVPETAQVDSASRVKLSVQRAWSDAVAVKTGVGVDEIKEQKTGVKISQSATLPPPPPTGPYGLPLNREQRPPTPNSRIQGLDVDEQSEIGAIMNRSLRA